VERPRSPPPDRAARVKSELVAPDAQKRLHLALATCDIDSWGIVFVDLRRWVLVTNERRARRYCAQPRGEGYDEHASEASESAHSKAREPGPTADRPTPVDRGHGLFLCKRRWDGTDPSCGSAEKSGVAHVQAVLDNDGAGAGWADAAAAGLALVARRRRKRRAVEARCLAR
jgi:hypothetical protein